MLFCSLSSGPFVTHTCNDWFLMLSLSECLAQEHTMSSVYHVSTGKENLSSGPQDPSKKPDNVSSRASSTKEHEILRSCKHAKYAEQLKVGMYLQTQPAKKMQHCPDHGKRRANLVCCSCSRKASRDKDVHLSKKSCWPLRHAPKGGEDGSMPW